MNESAEKEKAVAQETEGKNRELSDEEMDAAQVSGGTGGSTDDGGKLSPGDADKFEQQHYIDRVHRV